MSKPASIKAPEQPQTAGSQRLTDLLERKERLGSIGAIDTLIRIERERLGLGNYPDRPPTNYTPFSCIEIPVPDDIEKYRKPPGNFPADLRLPPIDGLANDYSFLESEITADDGSLPYVSVVVLTYNRCEPLKRTLAGIANQNYPRDLIEVIVTDDGGEDETAAIVKQFAGIIDVKYAWHRDKGFTAAAARNNGIRVARHDLVVLLDVDMYPSVNLIRSYATYSRITDRAVLIGPRKYVDMHSVTSEQVLADKSSGNVENNFTEVITNNEVAGKVDGDISVDWRLAIFSATKNLKSEKLPFRVFASGNVAFSRKRFMEVGEFDERFTSWGYEDVELAFRFFNAGMYFIPALAAMAYHQEPVGGINETNRSEGKKVSGELFGTLCPYYRHLSSRADPHLSPKVSIYIPTFNSADTICDAVESALKQTFDDLEVCICDDGSTDRTLELLQRYYSSNPRVRWTSQRNSGIGAASNAAVRLTRGIYVGQLDSDDYLATDVVERCVSHLDRDANLGLVYTTYQNESIDGTLVQGYNYPVFSREKLLTAMIAHHFRIFRRLYWKRTAGFSENIKNAVDYDMYLKLAEVSNALHLNVIGYRRRLHGANTSIVDFQEQKKNTAKVVNQSLLRLGASHAVTLANDKDMALRFEASKKNFS